jgi:2-dehydro-3-deoxygluconokinase
MTLADNSIRDLTTYILRSKSFLFSAIGLAVFKEIEKLFELLQSLRGKVRIHFDMNVRPALWERMSDLEQYLQRFGPLVDVLFISSTDDRHVFGERSGEAALASMIDAGYEQIVYRDGSHPTLGWSAQTGVVTVPTISNVTVVDATGAGDAFNAGFIAGSDRSFEESIRIGHICGALAIQERGGQAAHFKREDVLRNI